MVALLLLLLYQWYRNIILTYRSLVEHRGKLVLQETERPLEFSREPLESEDSSSRAWEARARIPAALNTQLLTIVVLEKALPGGGFATEFLFVMDHAWCDGLSISNLAGELLEQLAHGASIRKESLSFQTPVEVLAVERYGSGMASYWKRLRDMLQFLVPLIRQGEACKFPLGDEAVVPIPAADMGDCVVQSYTKRIPVKDLLSACKVRGVTLGVAVSAATCVAVARAVAKTNRLEAKHKPVAISLAADMRRRIMPAVDEHHLGFYVSALHSYFAGVGDATGDKVDSADDLWARAAHMSERFKQEAAELASYQLCQLLEIGLNRKPTHEGLATVALTNWGRIKVKSSYGDWTVKDVHGRFNPVNFLMPTMLISSFGGDLRLHLCVSEPAACGKAAAQIMDDIEFALQTMSQG